MEPTTIGVAKKICSTNCKDTLTRDFCDPDLTNDDTQVDICEKTGTGKFRQCTYTRTPAKCPKGYDSPISKTRHVVMPCKHDYDCRTTYETDKTRARCVGSDQPSIDNTTQKFCCSADLCGDIYLMRQGEKECTKEEECAENGSIGTCEAAPSGAATTKKHCCPKASIVAKEKKVEIEPPYRSNQDCKSLADCVGDFRFCHPLTNKCMYNSKLCTCCISSKRRPGRASRSGQFL